MFAERLAIDERDALVVLLAFMAATDGEVRDVERDLVRQLCERLDIDGDPFDRIADSSLYELCERLVTPHSRRIAIVEMIKAAYVDGEFHSSEERSIRVLAELMEVDGDTVTALEDWVKRGLIWKAEGAVLLG